MDDLLSSVESPPVEGTVWTRVEAGWDDSTGTGHYVWAVFAARPNPMFGGRHLVGFQVRMGRADDFLEALTESDAAAVTQSAIESKRNEWMNDHPAHTGLTIDPEIRRIITDDHTHTEAEGDDRDGEPVDAADAGLVDPD